jgi:hypothetical protein
MTMDQYLENSLMHTPTKESDILESADQFLMEIAREQARARMQKAEEWARQKLAEIVANFR